MAKKETNNSRANLAKRLRRRGLIGSIKGVETEYLEALWERYQNVPTVKVQKMVPKDDNYSIVKRILDNFVEEYKDYFIDWYRDAWRYLPEIEYFYQRLDVNKLNTDLQFVPREVNLFFQPPSDWSVNERYQMAPEDIADYLKELYADYLI